MVREELERITSELGQKLDEMQRLLVEAGHTERSAVVEVSHFLTGLVTQKLRGLEPEYKENKEVKP